MQAIDAILWPGATIQVDPRVRDMGGSWLPGNGKPIAWEYSLVHAVASMLREHPYPVLLDIGANTGSFALIPAVMPHVKVFAVEPHPFAFDILTANIFLNGISDQVSAWQGAISDTSGNGLLRCPVNQQSGLSILGGNPKRFKEKYQFIVETLTLDDWIKARAIPKPDLIKLDVEGHELAILHGAKRTLTGKHKPVLLLELYEPNCKQHGIKPDDVIAQLTAYGYTTQRINHENIWAFPRKDT
jgi:FkbM family methyltransferase